MNVSSLLFLICVLGEVEYGDDVRNDVEGEREDEETANDEVIP